MNQQTFSILLITFFVIIMGLLIFFARKEAQKLGKKKK